MKLSVHDRIMLLNIIPKEGDLTTIRIVKGLRERLSFSEEEHKALQFKNNDGLVQWQTDAETEVDVEIGDKAKEIICERLRIADQKKLLTEEHLPLWDRFFPEIK